MRIRPFRSQPQSDQAILSALRLGDSRALDGFYRAQRKAFLAWALKEFGVEKEEALDAYQQAFVVLYEKALKPDFQLSSKLSTFLFSIGKNLMLKRLRKIRVHQDHEAAIRAQLEGREEVEPLSERAQLAREGMMQMQEPCKSILRLFYYEEKKLSEIAQQLAYKNTDVVKSQKVRCLKRLEKQVRERLHAQHSAL